MFSFLAGPLFCKRAFHGFYGWSKIRENWRPSSKRTISSFGRVGGKLPKSASDFFFDEAKPHHTILQFTDLHHYNDGSREDKDGIRLISTLADRIRPELVVLTGNIVDARSCQNYSSFRNVVAPFIDLKIPWTYLPGNHDDETKTFPRKELMNVFSLPLCASKFANSFTHTIQLGPMKLYLIDSNGSLSTDTPTYQSLNSNTPCEPEVSVAFFYVPLQELKQSKALAGPNGEEPRAAEHIPAYFKALLARRKVHALFLGHDYWSDFDSELDGSWMYSGRVSGFNTSTMNISKAIKSRGGRVIQYDSSNKTLSTWMENLRGMERDSHISKSILQNPTLSLIQ